MLHKRLLFSLAICSLALIAPRKAFPETIAINTLHEFTGSDGNAPNGPLVQGDDGNFYGTTQTGGESGNGTVFKMSETGEVTTLHSFSYSDGSLPLAPLAKGHDGSFYGTTFQGGGNGATNYGTIFKITPAGKLTTLHSFTGLEDGGNPIAILLEASDLTFYGTTPSSPAGSLAMFGNVFRITPSGTFTTLRVFSQADPDNGFYPLSGLIQASDGKLYGTTNQGGPNIGAGTVYSISLAGDFHIVYSFSFSAGYPAAELVQANDGNLYGTTGGDIFVSSGTVFRLTTSGTLTTLYTFTGSGIDGKFPDSPLIQASDGNLYGTTPSFNGFGPGSDGTVFRIGLSGGLTTLFTFGAGIGSNPTGLLQIADGRVFGTTTGSSFAGMAYEPLLGLPPQQTSSTQFGNISTRLSVGNESNVLIGGLIVSGAGSKSTIVRAIGPSLAAFGVAGALANPKLELHDSKGALVASNDNWQDSPDKQAMIDAGLAPTDKAESAILMTLTPGAYTAIVSGVNNTVGVGLVEVYDLDPATDSTLANLSTRGLVETGDNVMIGGFIVLGVDSATTLVRVIGPTLTDFGVAGALKDPTVELHDGNGGIVASNDNWKDTQQTEIEATGLAPAHDAESATIQVLSPGTYTAIVRGKSDSTGVALVEVYHLK